MKNQNKALKMAVTQLIEISKEYVRQKNYEYSKLNQCKDRDEERELEKLYYNEIAATMNAIRIFTGREISFQWQGTRENLYNGFALYEILDDCPCDKIPCGVSDTAYSRYSGRQEKDRRIDWGKGKDEEKIIKIYEYGYDSNANPRYTGRYLVSEFDAE